MNITMPTIDYTTPQLEVVCMGNINYNLLWMYLIVTLIFFAVKLLKFEDILYERYKQRVDFGITYGIAMLSGTLSWFAVSYFASI